MHGTCFTVQKLDSRRHGGVRALRTLHGSVHDLLAAAQPASEESQVWSAGAAHMMENVADEREVAGEMDDSQETAGMEEADKLDKILYNMTSWCDCTPRISMILPPPARLLQKRICELLRGWR